MCFIIIVVFQQLFSVIGSRTMVKLLVGAVVICKSLVYHINILATAYTQNITI